MVFSEGIELELVDKPVISSDEHHLSGEQAEPARVGISKKKILFGIGISMAIVMIGLGAKMMTPSKSNHTSGMTTDPNQHGLSAAFATKDAMTVGVGDNSKGEQQVEVTNLEQDAASLTVVDYECTGCIKKTREGELTLISKGDEQSWMGDGWMDYRTVRSEESNKIGKIGNSTNSTSSTKSGKSAKSAKNDKKGKSGKNGKSSKSNKGRRLSLKHDVLSSSRNDMWSNNIGHSRVAHLILKLSNPSHKEASQVYNPDEWDKITRKKENHI
jgi:hypothetical protein